MQVKEIMTTRVSFVGPDTPISEIARRMRDEDIGSVPVADGDKLIGMVTDRDIVIRAVADAADARSTTARNVMSPKVLYCTEDQSIDDVLANMGEQQVRRLPVINAEKRLVGVVSLGDLSQAAARRAGGALKEISETVRH